MSAYTNIYTEQATELVRKHGYTEALRLALQWRGQSDEGTASFAFHNAVVKALRLFSTVGDVS